MNYTTKTTIPLVNRTAMLYNYYALDRYGHRKQEYIPIVDIVKNSIESLPLQFTMFIVLESIASSLMIYRYFKMSYTQSDYISNAIYIAIVFGICSPFLIYIMLWYSDTVRLGINIGFFFKLRIPKNKAIYRKFKADLGLDKGKKITKGSTIVMLDDDDYAKLKELDPKDETQTKLFLKTLPFSDNDKIRISKGRKLIITHLPDEIDTLLIGKYCMLCLTKESRICGVFDIGANDFNSEQMQQFLQNHKIKKLDMIAV